MHEDSPDLTPDFPNGVKSVIMNENNKKWLVFTKVSYHGAKVTLER